MKVGTKAVAYGILGLALASLVIFSGSELGLLGTRSSGLLSVLLTDPPSVPRGVTAIYITYSDIAIHMSGFGDTGWVAVPGRGTINSLKLVNSSQTVSSDTIPSLTYNQVALTISNVTVEFMGKNYSATTSSTRLVVPIAGGLKVNPTIASAALVDIQPTVLNLGDQLTPSFTMATGVKALQVPSADVDQSTKVVGHTTSLEGHDWYKSFEARHSDYFSVSGLTLTPNSLSFSATNSGTEPITIRTVVIAQNSQGDGESNAQGSPGDGVVFAVQSDGSLKLLNGPPGQVESYFEGLGYTLAAGATQQFSYSGTITNLRGNNEIVAGTNYSVIIIGSETLSAQAVVAS